MITNYKLFESKNFPTKGDYVMVSFPEIFKDKWGVITDVRASGDHFFVKFKFAIHSINRNDIVTWTKTKKERELVRIEIEKQKIEKQFDL